MKLKTMHPKIFSQLFEVLKENITDVLLHFHPDSIKIRATDHGKTHITYVNLMGGELEDYSCARYQPVGINMTRLWTVLKIAAVDDILEMEYDNEVRSELNISVIDSKTNAPKLQTGYITYDTTEEALAIPENITFDSCISMSSNRLYTDLKFLESLEAEFVKLRQCKSPTGGNRLQLIGMGSPTHKEPLINIDELTNNQNVDKHLGTVAAAPPPTTATAATTGGKKVKLIKPPQSSVPPVVVAPVATAVAVDPLVKKDLKEIEMVFPLKKLVQFAKAHCLDNTVGIHLDELGFLILQYKVSVYGDLRFVVMSVQQDNDEDVDSADEEEEQSNNKRPREEDDDEDEPTAQKKSKE